MGVNSITLGATDPSNLNDDGGVCVRARIRACARALVVRASEYVHTRACVHARECVLA